MTRLLIVGGGRMGEALLTGLLDAAWASAGDISVVEPDDDRAAELAGRHPGVDVRGDPCAADGAILATKPETITEVARGIGALGVPRMLSVAAGVRLTAIEAVVPETCAVIRAMSNTPALVGFGATAIARGSHAGDDDLAWASEMLTTVGRVVELPEEKLDAVTGLSGSGPAYVFLVAEALVEAGVLNGLDRATSTTLVIQTLLGASHLLAEQGDAPSLRAAVTSPGGTTAAGLAALERAGVRSAILQAVSAATDRAGELG